MINQANGFYIPRNLLSCIELVNTNEDTLPEVYSEEVPQIFLEVLSKFVNRLRKDVRLIIDADRGTVVTVVYRGDICGYLRYCSTGSVYVASQTINRKRSLDGAKNIHEKAIGVGNAASVGRAVSTALQYIVPPLHAVRLRNVGRVIEDWSNKADMPTYEDNRYTISGAMTKEGFSIISNELKIMYKDLSSISVDRVNAVLYLIHKAIDSNHDVDWSNDGEEKDAEYYIDLLKRAIVDPIKEQGLFRKYEEWTSNSVTMHRIKRVTDTNINLNDESGVVHVNLLGHVHLLNGKIFTRVVDPAQLEIIKSTLAILDTTSGGHVPDVGVRFADYTDTAPTMRAEPNPKLHSYGKYYWLDLPVWEDVKNASVSATTLGTATL